MSKQARPLMHLKTPALLSVLFTLCISSALVAADSKLAPANMSVAQIVDKHVAARGGAQAWHAVQTLTMTGKMDAGSGDSAARSEIIARESSRISSTLVESTPVMNQSVPSSVRRSTSEANQPFSLACL